MNPTDPRIAQLNTYISTLEENILHPTSIAAQRALQGTASLFQQGNLPLDTEAFLKLSTVLGKYNPSFCISFKADSNDPFKRKCITTIIVSNLRLNVEGYRLSRSGLPPLFKTHVIKSMEERQKNCKLLNAKDLEKFRNLELEFNKIEVALKKYVIETDKILIQEELQKLIDNLETVYREDFGFTANKSSQTMSLEDLFFITQQDIDTYFILRERFLNKFVDRKVYIREIQDKVNFHKDNIKSKFFSKNPNFTCKIENIEIFPGESHYKGKSPALIMFTSGERLVCKPRNAKIDLSIIELFSYINNLPSNSGEDAVVLHEYQIWNLPEMSFWEYIPGQTYDYNITARRALQEAQLGSAKQKKFTKKLEKMLDILKLANVGDLHGENFILNPDLGIVYIDLENIQKYEQAKNTTTLTQEEINLIERFNSSLQDIPHRIIVFGTTQLSLLMQNPMSSENTANLVINQLKRMGFTPLENAREILMKSILKDCLHSNIFYFTEYKNKIYHGYTISGVLITK